MNSFARRAITAAQCLGITPEDRTFRMPVFLEVERVPSFAKQTIAEFFPLFPETAKISLSLIIRQDAPNIRSYRRKRLSALHDHQTEHAEAQNCGVDIGVLSHW